jgi:hypothetical protein
LPLENNDADDIKSWQTEIGRVALFFLSLAKAVDKDRVRKGCMDAKDPCPIKRPGFCILHGDDALAVITKQKP